MPSMIAFATYRSPLDLTARTHVRDQRREAVETDPRDIGVGLGLGLDPLLAVADGGMREAHPSVEPWPAAEAADHRDRHGADDRGASDRPGMAEVEERG